MPYLGHSPTNAGSFIEIDDYGSSFNGSTTAFTLQVGGVDVTPNAQNLLVMIDGVMQMPGTAYSVSGSTITYTEAPASGADSYVVLMGQSASIGQGTIGADELKVSGNGSSGQVLVSDGDGTFSWATDTEPYLPLAGGTMTGTLAMGSNDITGVTSLTVDDMTFNGSTISDGGDLTFDIGGDIILDADDEHIFLKDGGTTIGNIDLGSQNITIRNSVSNADLIFRGNDGGTEVEAMRINYSGNNVGIGTSSVGAKLHVADNRNTAYSSTGEPAETVIAHNKNGTDNSGVNNYASLSFQVADGATSQGFLNYIRTGNNTGELTFSQRTGSSSYAEHMKIENNGNATFAGELRVNGGQASIYGAEGGNAILELNADEADDNADRWQMYVTANNNYLKWRHYGSGSWVDRLWLSSATDNWAVNLTGNSPYGMQITTTASNSSSHDVFKIKRGDGTTLLDVYGDGNTHVNNFLFTQKGIRIDTNASNVYPSIVGETADYELFRLEQWYGNEGSLVIKKDGSNVIRFTGGSSSVTSYIDNGANFGFGLQNPSSKVHIKGSNDDTHGQLKVQGTGTGADAQLVFLTDSNGRGMYIDETDSNSFKIYTGYGKSDTTREFKIDNNSRMSSVYVDDDGAYIGNAWNSSPDATSVLDLQGVNTNKVSYILRGYNGGSNTFRMEADGDLYNTNGTYGTISSDSRLKENISNATNKLDDINALNVKNFNYIGSDKKQIGFIADEFEKVFPSLVNETDTREYDEDDNVVSGYEDTKGLKVGMEFAILVKAIQELSARVEELENA